MKRLLKTVGLAFAGALLGYIIGSVFDPKSVTWYTWFFAGVPFGWSFLGRYFGHLVSTHLPTTLFLLVIRVALAGLLGADSSGNYPLAGGVFFWKRGVILFFPLHTG
ncbi:MAG: hypothetical protein HDR01_04320 [Lachnospiraceae bacterium]|nr:hypothetical protein [Lachnospiraceae bacterium]